MVQVLGVDVEVGEPNVIGSLSVFPLRGKGKGSGAYVPGPDAFAKGLVKVSELDPPEVPHLVVENLAPVALLLVEGETLVGGSQNRTLNTTVLCPPKAKTVVPVSCVEAGRWERPTDVTRSKSHLPGSLRAAKTADLGSEPDGPARWRSNQGRVWQEVGRQALRHGVESKTAALEDVERAVNDGLDTLLEELEPVPGQIGIACATGDRVLGVDIFDRPETLGSYLKSLVAGYRLDAEDGAGATLVAAVEQFLAGVAEDRADTGLGVGLGEEVRLRGPVTGLGLVLEGELVHLAAFPQPELP